MVGMALSAAPHSGKDGVITHWFVAFGVSCAGENIPPSACEGLEFLQYLDCLRG
jgi:hypothetical protein